MKHVAHVHEWHDFPGTVVCRRSVRHYCEEHPQIVSLFDHISNSGHRSSSSFEAGCVETPSFLHFYQRVPRNSVQLHSPQVWKRAQPSRQFMSEIGMSAETGIVKKMCRHWLTGPFRVTMQNHTSPHVSLYTCAWTAATLHHPGGGSIHLQPLDWDSITAPNRSRMKERQRCGEARSLLVIWWDKSLGRELFMGHRTFKCVGFAPSSGVQGPWGVWDSFTSNAPSSPLEEDCITGVNPAPTTDIIMIILLAQFFSTVNSHIWIYF